MLKERPTSCFATALLLLLLLLVGTISARAEKVDDVMSKAESKFGWMRQLLSDRCAGSKTNRIGLSPMDKMLLFAAVQQVGDSVSRDLDSALASAALETERDRVQEKISWVEEQKSLAKDLISQGRDPCELVQQKL